MKDHLGHFEWDDKKATLNLLKHGIEFEESALSFFDSDFIRLFDAPDVFDVVHFRRRAVHGHRYVHQYVRL